MPDTLRQRAEELAQQQPRSPAESALADLQGVLHELQVHQIELEMQNEELRRAQVALAQARDRFSDLYDFAPVGYLTLSDKNVILEANLTAAALLGVERGALVNRRLTPFIARQSQDVFYLFRKRLHDAPAAPDFGCFAGFRSLLSCELRLIRLDRAEVDAAVTGMIAQTAEGVQVCRLSLSDITERRWDEAIIRRQLAEIASYYDNAPIGLAALDTDLRYLRINTMLAASNGSPAADHIGRTVEEMAPGLAAQARQVAAQIRLTGKPVTDIEFSGETTAQPGVAHTWLESWHPIWDEARKIAGFTVMMQDIGQRKLAEAKIQRQLAELQLWYEATLDREERVIGLKREVNDLLCRLAEPARYPGV